MLIAILKVSLSSSQTKIGIIYFIGDNILKDSNGFYKIADFGLSKQCYGDASGGNFGLMTGNIGTPSHMAPEVYNKQIPYDMKSDIW